MDVQNLDETVYNYIFEIDDIKRAAFLYISRVKEIKSINFSNSGIQRRLLVLTSDFKKLCYKLIKYKNLQNDEDCFRILDSLILINTYMQKILQQAKVDTIAEKKKKRSLLKEYEKTEKYINAYSPLMIFVNNHSFTISLTAMAIFLLILIIVGFQSKDLFLIIYSLFAALALYIAGLIFHKKIERLFNMDRIEKTISKHSFIKSKKLVVLDKFSEKIIDKFIDKI